MNPFTQDVVETKQKSRNSKGSKIDSWKIINELLLNNYQDIYSSGSLHSCRNDRPRRRALHTCIHLVRDVSIGRDSLVLSDTFSVCLVFTIYIPSSSPFPA